MECSICKKNPITELYFGPGENPLFPDGVCRECYYEEAKKDEPIS